MKARKIIAALLIIIGLIIAFIALGMMENGAAGGKFYTIEISGLTVTILGSLWYDALSKRQ